MQQPELIAEAVICNNPWGVQQRLAALGVIPEHEGYLQEWDVASLKSALCAAADQQPAHQYWDFVASALDVPIIPNGDPADHLATQALGGGALLRSQLYLMQQQQATNKVAGAQQPTAMGGNVYMMGSGFKISDLLMLALAALALVGAIFLIKKL